MKIYVKSDTAAEEIYDIEIVIEYATSYYGEIAASDVKRNTIRFPEGTPPEVKTRFEDFLVRAISEFREYGYKYKEGETSDRDTSNSLYFIFYKDIAGKKVMIRLVTYLRLSDHDEPTTFNKLKSREGFYQNKAKRILSQPQQTMFVEPVSVYVDHKKLSTFKAALFEIYDRLDDIEDLIQKKLERQNLI